MDVAPCATNRRNPGLSERPFGPKKMKPGNLDVAPCATNRGKD